ncbi:Cupin 1 [Dillenia turbinata]|uniref:Germin-like protein n=1 Tax=Dillenia turbinata TaxID=194707 RepID=A0AAN8V0X3_9MAGN
MAAKVFFFCSLALAILCFAYASDSSPLQDFCVAVPTASVTLFNVSVTVNGLVCKDPKQVTANDFSFSGLHIPGNTSNAVGSKVTPVFVNQLPALNTLGISMARLDYAISGINPPHFHPRATEIFMVLEGSIRVGFVTSNPENRLITKVLNKGDVFVFPVGLAHFQQNVGTGNAVAIAGLSSQNPGVITVANAVFGSKPDIAPDALAKAFQLDKNIVSQLQAKF